MSNYANKERARYWPVSSELMAEYSDGSHNYEDSDSSLIWFQNNTIHRDGDKPAYIDANGSLSWYQNDLLHRDGDKPAIIYSDGELGWWQNDQRHRICGPAVINPDGTLAWFIYDENITQEVNLWLAGKEWQGTPEQIVEFKLRFHRRFT